MEEQNEVSPPAEEKAKEEFLKAREQLRGSLQEYMTIPELLGEHSGERDTAGRLDLSKLKLLKDGQHRGIVRHPDKHRAFCDTNGPHNVFKVSKPTLSTLYKAGCRAIGDSHSASDENAARFCDSVLGSSSELDVQDTPDHSKECPSKKFHSVRILATLLWCGLDLDTHTWRNYLRLMPGPAFCDCWLPFETSYTPTLRGLCKDRPAEFGEISDAQWRFMPLVFKANQLKPQRFINHQVNYRLPISEYRLIGEGNFGRVYKVKIENKHSSGSESEEYALKDIGSRSSGGPAKEWEVAAAIFRCTTEHKHIAAIRASFFVLDRTLLVLDLAAGDLESFMEHCTPPWDFQDRKKLMSAMADVGDALAWLQQNMNVEGRHVTCLHLDFKADNVLVFGAPSLEELKSPRATFKISDFGISRVYREIHNRMEEDRQYNIFRQLGQTSGRVVAGGDNSCPPEILLEDKSYETLCYRDVWSYGCVLARFMHWVVDGREFVYAFDNFRLYPDLGDQTDVKQTDRFFKQITVSLSGLKSSDLILRSDDRSGLEVCRLKERVRDHFKLLLQELARNKVDKEELEYFGAVIELLEEKVLVPNILHTNEERRDSTRSDVSILRGLLTREEIHRGTRTHSLPSSQDFRFAAQSQPDEAFHKGESVKYKRTHQGSRSSSFLAGRASHESAASGLSPKSIDSENLQFAATTPQLSSQFLAVRSPGTRDVSNATRTERTHSSDVIRPFTSTSSTPAATSVSNRATKDRALSDPQISTSISGHRTPNFSPGWRLPFRRILEPSYEKQNRHKVYLEGCLASPQISPDGRYVALMKSNTVELHDVGDASCNGLEPCHEPLLLVSGIDGTHWTAFCFNDAALCAVAEFVDEAAATEHAAVNSYRDLRERFLLTLCSFSSFNCTICTRAGAILALLKIFRDFLDIGIL
ncbi:hypothetical protein CKM354_000273600 [Cercospora kikuchii]|uniref:Protein kinase domain-containing protein n=1 Tax=Cercospora kikuchii TaxID=84275 RepID=A0A9P3CAG5_9PEZI|nr:uncharacterized protein CKM354_000273600 [Cercospora kikuchii]GIZ39349.1 hypothetical protein CKM354_000273600 [Cercospora kikuchii]